MLNDMIMDSAEELARDNALWMDMHDIDIVHRVSQMVENHIALTSEEGKLAIAAYRWSASKTWENHNVVESLEARLVA